MANVSKSFRAGGKEKQEIIIAGSDQDKLELLKSMLDPYFNIFTTGSGTNPADMLDSHKDSANLILLDMDSLADKAAGILTLVTGDPHLKHIPLIVISADDGVEVRALDSGAMDFISHSDPSPKTLLTHIHHTLDLAENMSIIRSTERDQLTGLYNKDYFFNYVEQYDKYHHDLEMDAILLNIRHFHMINERYGKNYGDEVLRSIGEKIRRLLKPGLGIACRRDADTFLIYCPHRTDYEYVFKREFDGSDNQMRLRSGIYPNVDKGLDIERRFDRAKMAADKIRDSFDRAIAYYDDKMRERELYNEQLLDEFPRALAEKQFVVYYQPKFAIQATLPVLNSAEALVRWIHPQRGMISPGDFIPLFESNGLIRQLDSYVWREVARQMQEWKSRLEICVPVSVNISRIDMLDADLVDHIKSLVAEFDLSCEEFLLEVTESAYTQDSEQIIKTVKELRAAGFRIEIDDFGSGYSSLNMISTLPIDALKLDMEFMRNAFKARKNTKMLDAVIDIADSLEVPTIAEGVETAEQMFALKEMGCDIVQGYYFSRPLPAAEYENFLLEKKLGYAHKIDADKESSIKAAEQFAYEALHDPLTGLYNHSAYKMLLKDADQRNIALLLVDVDDFRLIVSEYGEDTGKRMLELVADVLRRNFRSVDFICRIEEYEFAVIMTRMNRELSNLIIDKAERINKMLKDQQGELPDIELSIGVAFADRPDPQGDIFHDADLALQQVKKLKNNGCAIF